MDLFGIHLKPTAVVSLLLLGGVAGLLRAQRSTGEIRLQVKDPSGAAVAAAGTLRSQGGNVNQSFQTDTQGAYDSPACPTDVTGSRFRKTGSPPNPR